MTTALRKIDNILSELNLFESLTNPLKSDGIDGARIDHIIYFVKDLEPAISKFTELLGVKPVIGGRHLKWGSWNALFSLDDETYFELLADDPNSDIKHDSFLKDLVKHKVNGEGIITFMYRPNPSKYNGKLTAFKAMIHEQVQYDGGSIFGGERTLDDGKVLKWDLMCPLSAESEKNSVYENAKGTLGICIDWQLEDRKVHPSYTTPSGCKLLQLKCHHPDAGRLNRIMSTINMESPRFTMQYDEKVHFSVLLSTPKGIVTISD